MNIVRNGNDYEPQSVSRWRLRELLQHERDNVDLEAEVSRLRAALAEKEERNKRNRSEYEALWLKEEQQAIAAQQRAESAEADLARLREQLDELLEDIENHAIGGLIECEGVRTSYFKSIQQFAGEARALLHGALLSPSPTTGEGCRQKVLIFRNPEGAMALVVEDNRVVKATHPSYVGMSEDEGRLAAWSVMRYRLGTESLPTSADGYPEVVSI